MQEDFLPPEDAEQRAWKCIRREDLRVANARITALVELLKVPRVKFYEIYRAVVGLDEDLTEILKGPDDPSNLLPVLAIVKAFGAYSDVEVVFFIAAKFLWCSLTAASSLAAMVLRRKRAKIPQ